MQVSIRSIGKLKIHRRAVQKWKPPLSINGKQSDPGVRFVAPVGGGRLSALGIGSKFRGPSTVLIPMPMRKMAGKKEGKSGLGLEKSQPEQLERQKSSEAIELSGLNPANRHFNKSLAVLDGDNRLT
jgi:hypothetical protein